MSKIWNLLFYLLKEGDGIHHRSHTNIEEKEVEMLNSGENSWFRKYSCNSKWESILCSLSLEYVKTLLMTEIWIASCLENNEVVSFRPVLIPFRVRRICKILSAMIIKLNSILTSKFIFARLKNTFLVFKFHGSSHPITWPCFKEGKGLNPCQ